MKQGKYFPVSLMEKLSDSVHATGQKNYAQARQRAAQIQFNSQPGADKSTRLYIAADALHTDN